MTQITPDIQAAAAAIFAARESLTQIPPVRETHGITDVEAAYAVQALNTARWIEAGRRPVGSVGAMFSEGILTWDDVLGLDSSATLHVSGKLGTACGDLAGYDADTNYDLELRDEAGEGGEGGGSYVYHEPVQKPTTPAYRAYLEAQKEGRKLVLD